MKKGIFNFFLSVTFMMFCNVAWADSGTHGNTPVISRIDVGGGVEYDLYKGYSYTYKGVTKSCEDLCAVVAGILVPNIYIPSVVTYNNEKYRVIAIGEQAQASNSKKVTISNSVEVIEADAFKSMKNNLIELILEEGDNSLFCYPTAKGKGAFSTISTLKKLYLGRNLHYIGEGNPQNYSYAPFDEGAFSEMEIEVGSRVKEIPDFCFYRRDVLALLAGGVKKVNFSKATNLQSIGNNAFCGNTKIESIDFSGATALRSIGDYAFSTNTSLKQLDFSKNLSLQSIGYAAFYQNSSLGPHINFGAIPLNNIGRGAFAECPNLQKVFFFQNDAPVLGAACFDDNTNVYVKNNNIKFKFNSKSDFKGTKEYPECMMLKYKTNDHKVAGNTNCIYNTYEIDEGIMYFDDVLTTINDYWFDECNSLISVSIPNTVTDIATGAFFGCTNLKSIVFMHQ